ncbi:MAG TPA: hypothetical protein VN455_00440, partial [Methanotrichaceae archaeon]|nr:hypothetical protein [Methanotrichaceae archaeon]
FARRSPNIIIALGHNSQSWISLYAEGSMQRCQGAGIKDTVEALKAAMGTREKDMDIEKIWKVYYTSHLCPERRNIEGFHRRMPRKALNSAGQIQEQNKNGVSLFEFFNLK